MEILPLLWIFSVVFTGLTKGASVLPAGPLNAAVGDTVMFTTTLTPTEKPFVTIGWNIDGRTIITSSNVENFTAPEYEGRITLFISTGSLELRNLALSDSGEYRVFIVQQGGLQSNGNTRLEVLERVSNVVATANDTDLVEFKDSVRLSCSSSGSSLSFLWLNSSSEVTASDRVQLIDGNSTLTIVSVTRYDNATFSCRVFNPVSSATSEPILLSIYQRISNASVTSSSTQPIEGKSVNLTCEAAGSVVTRKWKKGDSYVLPDHIKLYDNNRVLSFQPLKKTDDGEYSCEISNPVSNNAAKYIMIVNYGPENVQITGPSEIHLNQTMTLTCSAKSTPAASYTWTLNGTEIHKSAVFTKVITKLSDSGNYSCEARNIITGRTSSAVHGLTVTAIPDKTSSCSAGCIAGIVIACLVVCGAAAGGGGYYIYKKKKMAKKPIDRNTATVTGGAGQDNAAYSANQEVNYADISFFQNRAGGRVQLGTQNDTPSQYAQVHVNSGRPAGSSPPTYDAYVQRASKRPAPQPTGTQVYAGVRKN